MLTPFDHFFGALMLGFGLSVLLMVAFVSGRKA
jgi:hypothetical protein